MVLCVPVKGMVQASGISCRKLPGCRTISTIHKGGYDELGFAYKALLDAAYERNLQPVSPSREIYRKGPGLIFRGNPSNYVTELMSPVREMDSPMPVSYTHLDVYKRQVHALPRRYP